MQLETLIVDSPMSCSGFLGRPPINKTSTLVESIIKAHGSKRVLSYVEAGCVNTHDSVRNVSKCKSDKNLECLKIMYVLSTFCSK